MEAVLLKGGRSIILNRSDTQGRLRAVLRATDSGEEGIDITTKQALTNDGLVTRP
jgi:hypothetical protein